ncbi:hypothetical protein JCM31826_12220 [Thermaurantimonas aggregans]|uniref:ABC-2 type transporter domain-containing protein n=1 Tax=Thermaurantimonas aggregans TaxID=2173829 RepID=A0A401XL76_9FLAO|nr:hypothetical protein [Thermaurantimonas aggregans]MCX8149691.1 hypothetical protein [Thermaurantimonas aggregans]GCD77740.1 hypothetical protein JCM31826_12220 [Thermaurantimonas aggregans]
MKAGEYHNTPENTGLPQAIKEVLEVRRAVAAYGWRDVKIRYIRTYLGWGWLLLPAVLLLLPVLLLQARFGMKDQELSQWVTVLSGHILSAGLMQQIAPLWINNKHFLLKIRLPVLFMPISRLVVMLPEWILYSIILTGLGVYLDLPAGSIALQWFVFQLFWVFGFSMGVIFCAISSRFRDVIHAVPVVIQGQLLLIVLYMIHSAEFQAFSWLEWLPPVLFINLLKNHESSVLIVLTSISILSFAYVSAFVFVKLSKNALERI